MDVVIHHVFQFFYGLDPIVLDGVGQATEDVVAVLHSA
jgi:hypothetical protein